MHGNVSLDLSTASVAELRQSLNELSQGQTIQPASDFPDRFVSRRGTHIQVVQQSEIVPEKFFRNGIHQKYELPPVNFTRAEQNMTDDYVRLGYWAWSVPVQTTVDRTASASLSAFLSESAVPHHEGSVSGSNDPVSADLHDDTSSLQLGSRLTEGNPGGGAFSGGWWAVAKGQHRPSRRYVTSGADAQWTGTGEFANCGRYPSWIWNQV